MTKGSKDTKDKHADDRALWLTLTQGNSLAFSSLYNRYANPLFNYGMHICYNRDLVKDCIQELFAWLWKKKYELSAVDSVKYYLFKSFRNILIKAINQSKKFTDEAGEHLFLAQELSKEEELIALDRENYHKEKITKALGRISKRQREILILRFFNEMSYTEISSMMGISTASAHNLLSKALQAMKVII